MEVIKVGTSVANAVGDKEKLEDLGKLADGAIKVGTDLATNNFVGAITKGVALGTNTVSTLVKNKDFIADEVKKSKEWDAKHNKDGSPKTLILL